MPHDEPAVGVRHIDAASVKDIAFVDTKINLSSRFRLRHGEQIT